MFEGVACHFELIFGLLTNTKCDLVELEIEMFEVFDGTLNLFWTSVLAQNPIWMKPKKR